MHCNIISIFLRNLVNTKLLKIKAVNMFNTLNHRFNENKTFKNLIPVRIYYKRKEIKLLILGVFLNKFHAKKF